VGESGLEADGSSLALAEEAVGVFLAADGADLFFAVVIVLFIFWGCFFLASTRSDRRAVRFYI
jgi:hypothetical protein